MASVVRRDDANRKQRQPETIAQAEEQQRRRSAYLASGVGGEDCLTGTCHIAASFASGEGYGPPAHDACAPCAAAMASWGGTPVSGTSYVRLPGGRRIGSLNRRQRTPGVVVPEQRQRRSETVQA